MNARQQPEHFPPTRQQRTSHAYDAETMADEDEDNEDVDAWPPRMQRSALPYRYTSQQQPPIPSRRTQQVPARASAPVRQTQQPPSASRSNRGLVPVARQEEEPPSRRRRRWHPLFYVGVALCIMVLGFVLIQAVSGWWQTTVNQWQYGYPRTFQTDAVVGHNDSETNPSHFIALNLHGHVQVIEYPGGDVTHARLYIGPTLLGADSDLAPVTLSFRDVNGDGKLDMIISAGSTITVMINDSGQFRPLKPGEPVTL